MFQTPSAKHPESPIRLWSVPLCSGAPMREFPQLRGCARGPQTAGKGATATSLPLFRPEELAHNPELMGQRMAFSPGGAGRNLAGHSPSGHALRPHCCSLAGRNGRPLLFLNREGMEKSFHPHSPMGIPALVGVWGKIKESPPTPSETATAWRWPGLQRMPRLPPQKNPFLGQWRRLKPLLVALLDWPEQLPREESTRSPSPHSLGRKDGGSL